MSKLPKFPWIEALMQVYGLHEVTDKEKLSKWLRSDGKYLGDPSQLPWCGDAVDTAMGIGLPKEGRPGDLGKNPYWALNWGFFGVASAPFYGAVAAFKRPEGGHVGFLVGQSDTEYQVFGGNQGDKVKYTWIEKSRCKFIRWPSTYENPRVMLPRNPRGFEPASTNEK